MKNIKNGYYIILDNDLEVRIIYKDMVFVNTYDENVRYNYYENGKLIKNNVSFRDIKI